jgi:hypothetical protein
MSIRKELAKLIAGKEPAQKTADVVQVKPPEDIPQTNETALGRMSAGELRSLLLNLVPDPVSGRSGPVQLLSPFESEKEVKTEMARVVHQLTESHQRVFDLSQRLAVFESSEKDFWKPILTAFRPMVKELEAAKPRIEMLEGALRSLLFLVDAWLPADERIANQLEDAITLSNAALGTANAQSKSE